MKMVTSNKLPEKKFVTMAGQNPSAVVPQRTLLGEVNEHITCPLCRGYYIDATTIVECLHSFCRSCIIKHLQVKSYCPVCEMMINSAKPNIKLDKALQDIVYKLVPGLFQKEMERRQQFYASRPGPAASATPEQRGEDTERIIFSPEDVISFSLEYVDATDADSISSKSSDSNEAQPTTGATRRYLQCPAVVNISHLKKFLSMKFDIDSSQFAIDILYKRVPLPDYYTLMDIAYIYNWKRNEPMRFFYQIIDYIAIRNRIFDINRKGSHFRDRKSSPTSTEDTNVSSPAPNLNDQGSEGSSGSDSPMPDDSSVKQANDTVTKCDKNSQQNKSEAGHDIVNPVKNVTLPKKSDDEVEKSQFLNSFELTAKNSCASNKTSPTKSSSNENSSAQSAPVPKAPIFTPKLDDSLKRKHQSPPSTPELKKVKIELEKSKLQPSLGNSSNNVTSAAHQNIKTSDTVVKAKDSESTSKHSIAPTNVVTSTTALPSKELKSQQIVTATVKQSSDNLSIKRTVAGAQNNTSSPKRKPNEAQLPAQTHTPVQKTVSPLKLQVPKLDTQSTKSADIHKPPVKKMPDLKPSSLASQTSQNKPHVNKVRMDLLANNSDPTIDRSKILSQVKSSLSCQNTLQSSGDPLKSIFDSCNINIPSSLSITLTDQKLDGRNPSELVATDQKKNVINKNFAGVSGVAGHKVPSPPVVHNYIEILKLPDTELKKTPKIETISDIKINLPTKSDTASPQPKPPSKSSETSAKGPVPNLKPIADTKLGKQTGNYTSPITFQQTFEQQLQSLQTDKKPKLPKTKTQVPKLVPAPKVFNVVSKTGTLNKPNTGNLSTEQKPSSALDLSTPHTIQSQGVPQQTFDKALETMQSIANLAKKQNLPSKGLPLTSIAQSNAFSSTPNRPLTSSGSSIRVPSSNNVNQMKMDKPNQIRQDIRSNPIKPTNNPSATITSQNYQIGAHNPATTAQPSPRSQTRSPSSSPKLVIAEEKQASNMLDQGSSQVMSMMNHQVPLLPASKNESPKPTAGPSKSGLKPVKSMPPAGKVTGIRPAINLNQANMNASPDYLTRPQVMSAHHALLRHQMDAWIKVQRQFDLMKSMSNMAHQSQNDFNNKEKQ